MEAKPERLQKILAAAGLASRRKAEELIAAGRVSVNGHVVTEPGTKADPRLDEIRVDGQLLRGPERHVYLAMYKPKGYMTTVSDPEGRPTVMDLLKGVEERVFPVGRLDYMSEGLLLLTNDGDLMAELTRAGSHVAKTYMVKVSGKPTDEAIDKLRNGIMLPPEPGLTGARGKKQPGVERRSFAVRTQPAAIQLAVDQENPWFEVTLTEGRNRQLRRMFEQIGHHIEKIKRIRYGSLTLDVEPGEFRHLTPKEVGQLRNSLKVPFKPKPIKAKQKTARPERTPRLDAARFVKGRRGKLAPETESAPATERPRRTAPGQPSAARPAFGRASERRPFREREDRGQRPAFGGSRGPQFDRAERLKRPESEREERSGGKRPFARKPRPDFDSGFEKRGAAAKPGFDRRFSRGPGKPPSGAKPERGGFGRTDEASAAGGRGFERKPERGPRPGKGFGSRRGDQAPERPAHGEFKRGEFSRGEFKRGAGFPRPGGAKFKRPEFEGRSPEGRGFKGRAPEGQAQEGQRPGRTGSKRPGFGRPSSGPGRGPSRGPTGGQSRGTGGGQRSGRSAGPRSAGQRSTGQSGGRFGRPSAPRRGGGPPRPPRRPQGE